jgi:hypothetical protein
MASSSDQDETANFGELLPTTSKGIEIQHAHLHDRYAHLGVALICGALDDMPLTAEDRQRVTIEMMVIDALLGRETLQGKRTLPIPTAYRRTFSGWREIVTQRYPALSNPRSTQLLTHVWENVERTLKR